MIRWMGGLLAIDYSLIDTYANPLTNRQPWVSYDEAQQPLIASYMTGSSFIHCGRVLRFLIKFQPQTPLPFFTSYVSSPWIARSLWQANRKVGKSEASNPTTVPDAGQRQRTIVNKHCSFYYKSPIQSSRL